MFLIIKNDIVIPEDSIRLRIIANSDSEYDQNVKVKVKDSVQEQIFNLLKDSKSKSEAEEIINTNLDNINETVKTTLLSNNYNLKYNVNFGMNYFPEKEYRGVKYKEGMYESLVVTLGEGEGKNWWCVLFPPFCLIEANETEVSDVQYRLLIKEIINKYF